MPEVIIIGGGFSGLAMAVQLKKKFMMQDFLLIERGSSLGGVWANNRYPGVACDIPSPLYSLSSAQEYWSSLFGDGDTIQQYIERTASKYHIPESNTLFSAEVTSAVWNDLKSTWTVRISDLSAEKGKETRVYTCKILISAVGNLSIPNEINIPGKERFKSTLMHTGRYDTSVDLHGKNVVVLGNGCTAVQLIPAIAPHVASLTIFARSKHWYLPRPTLPFPWLFDILSKYLALGRLVLRYSIFIVCENGIRAMHADTGKRYREKQEQASKDYITRTAPARHHDKLIPTFAFGSKRLVFDVKFLETLHQPNVDYHNENIKEITEDGVLTQDGRTIPADVIIAATGFQAQQYLLPMQITGQDGQDLHAHMSRDGQGLSSYKGTFYSSFPNFATIYGPNTGTGHSSAIFTQECQVNMILKRMILPVLQEENVDSVVVRPEKEAEWMAWLRKEMKETVWEKEQKGWYSNSDGYCTTLYPRGQFHFWYATVMTSAKDFIYSPREHKGLYGLARDLEYVLYTVLLLALFASISLFSS